VLPREAAKVGVTMQIDGEVLAECRGGRYARPHFAVPNSVERCYQRRMGSDLYSVTVLARKGSRVKLGLKIIHPDAADIPADRSFVLMLLLSPDLGQHGAIWKEVPWDDAQNGTWMKKHAGAYVTDIKAAPLRGKSSALDIGVSHPAWIEHLAPGVKFTSRAYANAKTYDRCAPVAPVVHLLGVDLPRGKRLDTALTHLPGVDRTTALQALADARLDATARPEDLTKAQVEKLRKLLEALHAAKQPADESGFLCVPRALWMRWIDDAHECPEFLSVPAYGPDAYVVVEEAALREAKKLRSWLGVAVRRGDKTGALFLGSDKKPDLLSYWHDRAGHHWSHGGALGTTPVGRLALRTGGRRKVLLTYKQLLPCLPGVATAAKAKGKVLTLTLEHGPASAAAIASATDVLWILLQTLPGRDLTYNDGRAPLARATRKAGVFTLQKPLKKVLSEIVSGYIAGYELERPKPRKVPDLDKMSPERVKEFFLSHPFGKTTLTIKVTDARWLEHIKPDVFFELPNEALPKPVTNPAGAAR
jgi:ribosomal protein S13